MVADKILQFATRKIGAGYPCFVIAEAGVNHNGKLEMALELVDVAVQAGADAVKFQTFNAEKLVSANAPKAAYQKETTSADETQLEMIKRLELPFDAFRELKAYCESQNILFLSTPFDEGSADFLESLAIEAYKVPSGEITNHPFLEHLAKKNKPLILSTGMSYLGEVEAAVRVIQATGNLDLVLLHCVSQYPTAPHDVNLRAMQTLEQAFQIPVGFSDHTMGIEVALAAVALGATIVEKHFTLDNTLPGPDHRASLEPDDLAALVKGIRSVESALGHGRKEPAACELDTLQVARKSLVADVDIPAGVTLTADMIAIKRPGTGLSPSMMPYIIGRETRKAVTAGTLITWEML